MRPRVVGPVTASAKWRLQSGLGTGQEVICTGKAMSRVTRATRAGLNGLWPKPPKGIFAMPMATSAPITMIQIGRLEGTLKASNKPVTTAEPSLTLGFWCSMKRWMRYSNSTQHPMETAVRTMTGSPK